MKIVTSTVGSKGPGGEEQNEERLAAAKRALEKATNLGAALIALPAGLFTANDAQTRNIVSQSLISIARELGIAVIFGVDQENGDYQRDIQEGGLPWYGYAWSPTEDMLHCWPQRSTNNQDQWLAPERVCKEVRLVTIRGESIAVLLCGEIFNKRIRDAVADYQPRPEVVVDIAHVGRRFRIPQGMKVLARFGLPSLCSVHAQCERAVKHCYVPPGRRMSCRVRDAYVYGPPHIELKLWTF